MPDRRSQDSATEAETEQRPQRRGYEKPAVVWEERLDVIVNQVACAKVGGTTLPCNSSPAS